ncbi:EFR1 family ferrodoxin [Cetobacterium sp. ZOR0034]|uniref:EFR1 family ferrodoxin n=1 Tax=Cetobacterium sp. ZOR0034 TaxID=1339239 RepID=UPI0006488694|nr:EFR1 family ferrodoxin [Cetobacterium sp. ZOR0034]
MNMKTIYYFSGTGNTLYLAKFLKDNCSYNLVNIAEVLDKNIKIEGEVGFLFPIYAMGIPKLVEKFIKNIEIGDAKYIFAIATCGGSGYGIPFQQINNILKNKSTKLNYSEYCHMPDNYLKLFKPLSESDAKIDLEKSSSKMKLISKNISNQQNSYNKSHIILYPIFLLIYKFWRLGLKRTHKSFEVSKEKCITCKICEKVCPVDNIKLENEIPSWQNSCEECLACVNLCPTIAISCGKKSKHNMRYKNPYILVTELIKQKSGS